MYLTLSLRTLKQLLVLMMCMGCQKEDTSVSHDLEYSFLQKEKTVNPKMRGIWKSIGNGYILNASQDSILIYSYTSTLCYKEKNSYLEGLLNSESQFVKKGDTVSIYLTDYGDRTTDLQVKRDFVRIPELPDCLTFDEMQSLKPRELFALYLENMKENYGFSKERQMNWDSIEYEFSNKVSNSTSSEMLFEILGEIATLTRDQHTKVIDSNGRTLQYRVTPSAKLVVDSFYNQSKIKDLNQFFNNFFEHNYTNISDSLLQGKGKKVANDKIEWGRLNADIGYISIYSFTGFGSRMTRIKQIERVNFYMKKIIEELKDTDAIIVDISFNFGGYDASGLTIAGYFTDKEVDAYHSQVFYDGGFYNESTVRIIPAKNANYTKPVYLLSSDISRSAAESFAMMMDVLPNTKLVGTKTLGTLSGMLGKSVGPFYTTISNQRLLNLDGECFEVKGVEPDIQLTVFEKTNVFESHKFAVQQLAQMITKNQVK